MRLARLLRAFGFSTFQPGEQSARRVVDRESAALNFVEEGLPSTEEVAANAAIGSHLPAARAVIRRCLDMRGRANCPASLPRNPKRMAGGLVTLFQRQRHARIGVDPERQGR